MQILLKSFEFQGIKNINTMTKIDFISKKNLTNDNLQDNLIKAIYGPNGSGKTALIKALVLYKYLVLTDNFLIKYDNYFKTYLNKSVDDIIFKMTYITKSSTGKMAKQVEHEVRMTQELDIVFEQFVSQNNIIEIKNGEIKKILNSSKKNLTKEQEENIKDKTKNLLTKSTFSAIFLKNGVFKNNFPIFEKTVFPIIISMIETNIIVEEKDEQFLKQISQDSKNIEEFEKLTKKNLIINRQILNVNKILEEHKERYEQKWQKIEQFLKIMKPQIQKIKTEYKEKEGYLVPQISIQMKNTLLILN
ncbi:MAG: hypothetical protein ACK5HR_03265 [Mycoplasmatales bacterium]